MSKSVVELVFHLHFVNEPLKSETTLLEAAYAQETKMPVIKTEGLKFFPLTLYWI